jgi:hypothetical protein
MATVADFKKLPRTNMAKPASFTEGGIVIVLLDYAAAACITGDQAECQDES